MTDFSVLNIWGTGQLLGFSAFDGDTDCQHGLLLRTSGNAAIFELKQPVPGGTVIIDSILPQRSMVAGDHFAVEGRSGTVRGAFADAYHLLLEGPVTVAGLTEAVRIKTAGNRTLLGTAAAFNPSFLEADFDRLFAERQAWLNALSLPENLSDNTKRTLFKACSQLKTQLNSPDGVIRHRWTTPDRWPHRWMWLWDSVFHAIGLCRLDPGAARDSLRAMFDSQKPDGFVPHSATPSGSSEITQPPLFAFGMKHLERVAPDEAFLRELYPRNKRFLQWIFLHRDSDGAGLAEWAIEAHENCRSGESGMDNSTRFDGAIQLDAPDFNAYLASECEIMGEFAQTLGFDADIPFWSGHHARLNKLMNARLWNDQAGLYVDRDVVGDRQSPVLSSAGFLPLISGAPTPEMAGRLAAHLRNAATFGTPRRVPSISRSQPEFYSKDMWRGPVWININYLIAYGLERYGFVELADELRRDSCRMIEEFYLKYGTCFEFYDDRDECDPPQLLRKRACNPQLSPYHQVFMDYGWTATLYIDMVFNRRSE